MIEGWRERGREAEMEDWVGWVEGLEKNMTYVIYKK